MMMTDEEKVRWAAAEKRLELLFDYTKFHIGLYLTLTASYIALATAEIGNEPILTIRHEFFFWAAIVAFMVAGLSGGVIASSITQTSARDSDEFLNEPIGPWEWKRLHFQARKWTWIEHTSFWVGLIAAVVSFKPPLAPVDEPRGLHVRLELLCERAGLQHDDLGRELELHLHLAGESAV